MRSALSFCLPFLNPNLLFFSLWTLRSFWGSSQISAIAKQPVGQLPTVTTTAGCSLSWQEDRRIHTGDFSRERRRISSQSKCRWRTTAILNMLMASHATQSYSAQGDRYWNNSAVSCRCSSGYWSEKTLPTAEATAHFATIKQNLPPTLRHQLPPPQIPQRGLLPAKGNVG